MFECVAIGEDGGVTANFALGTVGEDAENGFAFKVRDREGDGRYVRNIGLRDWNDGRGLDRDAAVNGAETIARSVFAQSPYRLCAHTWRCWHSMG